MLRLPGSLLLIGILLALAVLYQGWSPRADQRPSVLVFVIEQAAADQFDCVDLRDDEIPEESPGALCSELTRYSRTYTPSTLAAPAFGALLTSQYPFQTGFRHPGAGPEGHLEARFETLAETAMVEGYKTAFWSASPSLLKRHGLGQGFTVFDESFLSHGDPFSRTAAQQAGLVTAWFDQLRDQDRFFSVVHLSDLLFSNISTLDDDVALSEPTARQKTEEIWRAIHTVSLKLKAEKKWDSTLVVIAGLNGQTDRFDREYPAQLSVTAEATRVALFVKPVKALLQKSQSVVVGRPQFDWVQQTETKSQLTSLIDVGHSLREVLTNHISVPQKSLVQISDLALEFEPRSLFQTSVSTKIRPVLSESAWAQWRLNGAVPVRVAVRSQALTLVNDQRLVVYEQSTDPFEVNPIPTASLRSLDYKDARYLEQVKDALIENGFRLFPEPSRSEPQLQRLLELSSDAVDVFSLTTKISPLERLSFQFKWSTVLKKKWDEIERLRRKDQRLNVLLLSDVRPKVTRADVQSCLDFILSEKTEFADGPLGQSALSSDANRTQLYLSAELKCGAKWFAEFRIWRKAESDSERTRALDRIAIAVATEDHAVRFAEQSMALGFIWEAGSIRAQGLELWEFVLARPEHQTIQQSLMRRQLSNSLQSP